MAQKSLVGKAKEQKIETQVIDAPPPAPSSNTTAVVPFGDKVSTFLQTQDDTPFVQSMGSCPWAAFAHKMSPNWDKDSPHIPGMQEGDLILHIPGANPVKVDPIKFLYIRGYQYWAIGDGAEITDVSLTPQRRTKEKKWSETIEAAILLYHERRLIPCTIRAASVKCPAFTAARKGVEEAAAPDWVNKSEGNKAAAKVPHPFARVITTVSFTKGVSKSSGFAYKRADGSVAATTEEHWSALLRFSQDDEARQWFEQVIESFNTRSAEIKSAAAETSAA